MLRYFLESPIASLLMLVMLVMSIAGMVKPSLRERWSLWPSAVVRGKYFQLFTSGFVHASVLHLVINALTFASVGFQLENDLVQMTVMKGGHGTMGVVWGHVRFALIWLVGMLVSDLPTILRWRKDPRYSTLGSSGAVSAMVTGIVVLNPSWTLGAVPGWAFALFYVVYSLLGTRRQGSVINHSAHLWGALAGALLMLAYFPSRLGVIFHQVQQWFG